MKSRTDLEIFSKLFKIFPLVICLCQCSVLRVLCIFSSYYTVPPTITPSNNLYSVTSVKDYPYTLSFTITDDFPKVKTENIFWHFTSNKTRETDSIQENDIYSISAERLSLRIADVELDQRGDYTLTATNEAGVRNATINMDVHG